MADAAHSQRPAADFARPGRPTANGLPIISDYDGDEQWDIFFVSPKTGQVVNITNTREISEESPTWSSNGRYLAYTVKPKTSSVYRNRHLRHIDARDQTPDHRHARDKMNVGPVWSADSKWIVYTQAAGQGHRLAISSSPRWPPASARC